MIPTCPPHPQNSWRFGWFLWLSCLLLCVLKRLLSETQHFHIKISHIYDHLKSILWSKNKNGVHRTTVGWWYDDMIWFSVYSRKIDTGIYYCIHGRLCFTRVDEIGVNLASQGTRVCAEVGKGGRNFPTKFAFFFLFRMKPSFLHTHTHRTQPNFVLPKRVFRPSLMKLS